MKKNIAHDKIYVGFVVGEQTPLLEAKVRTPKKTTFWTMVFAIRLTITNKSKTSPTS